MFLRSLEIKNYRSLEDIQLPALDRFNVLIGRNNSGKSSVFGALEFLSTLLVKGGSSEPDPNRVLSRLDATRRFEIGLTCELGTDERRDFIDLVRLGGPDPGARDRLLASQFLRRVSYRFQAPPTAPNLPHLRETKLIAENGVWATVQRMTGHETTANPVNSFLAFRSVGETFAYHSLQASTLDIDRVTATQGSRMVPEHNVQSVPLESQVPQDDGSTWLRERLKEYLSWTLAIMLCSKPHQLASL